MQMYDIWSILCYKNENVEDQIVSCSNKGQNVALQKKVN